MYEIKKTENITEDLKITSNSGELVIRVEINISAMARKISAAQMALLAAKSKAEKEPNNTEILNQYGNATVRFFETVFGGENTEKIIEFYKNDYVNMVYDIFPFINGVILRRIREVSKGKADAIIKNNKVRLIK